MQKHLLYAIAREGEVEKITSSAFIKKHSLVSASANQYAAKQLVANGIVTKLHGKYSLNEQFFGIRPYICPLSAQSPLSSVRYPMASARCMGSTCSQPAKSAMVRATFRMRL